MVGRQEHQRARVDHVREHSGIILRIRRDLGNGDVAGSPYEFPELPVCHGMTVHPEAVHGDAMRRGFFGIMPVRSHAKSAAVYPDHFLDVCEDGVTTEASDVGLAAGCAVIFERCLPIDRQTCIRAGIRYAGESLPRYWTVVQHRAGVCAVPPVAFFARQRCERDPGLSSGPMLRR